MQSTRVAFGNFELDTRSGELRRSGRPLPLAAQPTRALAYLVARAGRLVTRQELQHHIWGDAVVELDLGLNACIRQIRVALDDRAEAPAFIETVPRQGYRFIAEVRAVEPDAAKAPPGRRRRLVLAIPLAAVPLVALALWDRTAAPPPTAPPERTLLAVLPFENLSGDPGQEYFSEGMTEELITELARLDPARLGVIARTSAMRYKGRSRPIEEVAAELGVGYVVEGSVRSGENGELRVVAQLIRVADLSHRWAARYDRPPTDQLEVQLDVARQVARELGRELFPDPQRSGGDPRARDAYLRGRYHLSQRSKAAAATALEQFRRAIELDPDYAEAYLGEADALARIGGADSERLLRDALRRALEHDDGLATAHLRLAQIELYADWNFEAAGRSFRRALELEPGLAEAHHSYAVYLSILGWAEEAVAALDRALELDPVSISVRGDGALVYFAARRFEAAAALCRRTLELDPSGVGPYSCLFDVHHELGKQSGDFTEAVAAAEQLMAARGASEAELAQVRSGTTPERLAAYAAWNLEFSRRLQAPPVAMAVAHLLVGEIDQSFSWLEEGFRRRSTSILFVASDPRAEPYAQDPRLLSLVRRIGLPQAAAPAAF